MQETRLGEEDGGERLGHIAQRFLVGGTLLLIFACLGLTAGSPRSLHAASGTCRALLTIAGAVAASSATPLFRHGPQHASGRASVVA